MHTFSNTRTSIQINLNAIISYFYNGGYLANPPRQQNFLETNFSQVNKKIDNKHFRNSPVTIAQCDLLGACVQTPVCVVHFSLGSKGAMHLPTPLSSGSTIQSLNTCSSLKMY